MKIETKFNTGDKVSVQHGESAVETRVIGITATEVIEGPADTKRSSVLYTLEFNREKAYTESDLSPVAAAKESSNKEVSGKEFDKAAEKLKA